MSDGPRHSRVCLRGSISQSKSNSSQKSLGDWHHVTTGTPENGQPGASWSQPSPALSLKKASAQTCRYL